MQIKGIKVEWTQTFEHHCIFFKKNLDYEIASCMARCYCLDICLSAVASWP